MRARKALIIGCGIAGPTLALFLKRAGIEAEIYEARETLDGYSLSLSCNGVAVLQELGLDQAIYAEGSAITRWSMWNSKNKFLGRGVLAGGGLKSVFIKRIPLGKIIIDEAERQGIRIMRGKKLQDIKTTEQGGVVAAFSDGSTASGDLLIGADGVHSQTRKFVAPTFNSITYTRLINSGGYTSGVTVSGPPETINFIFCRRAFFGYHVTPTGYIYWFTNWVQDEEAARGAFDQMTDAERKQQMLAIYKDDQPLIREIIQRADETFPYFASYTLPEQPISWHRGPVVLSGDAAHAISPSSGQGASMALEDAAILAKCLRDIPDLEQAFSVYERLRRERTIKMYDAGKRGDSGKFVMGPRKQWFRDLTTPIFLKLFANPKASDWMYAYRTEWDKKADLTAISSGAEK
ncbi:FAD-dependent oxidoreductase [Dictyobacter sp. S3.2.2.5]|uniref:FAD-dependent oxidoreductase n=1 Tax=Dictyobacter halimunensis TaxID=3026934 RepID=A0ABQ6FNV0_9CHLR|nr:FAD-dependent oxidoreductase [Dictyobacter sp. S3.2.2.5]